MTKSTFRSSVLVTVLLISVLLLSGCFAKKIMADDKLQAPAPKEITGRLFESTVGKLLDQPAQVGEVWLLPTPTPVPEDLFDKVFGKARELLPTPMPMPIQSTERWGTVTVPALNVRSGPGTDAAVIAGLIQDQRVKVEDELDGWLQITLDDGQKGWSSSDFFIVEETAVTQPTPEPETLETSDAGSGNGSGKGIVLADFLNVRSLPDLAGSIVASLGRNECVDVMGEQDGWFQISVSSGKFGWSTGEFVQKSDACPTPAPVDTSAVGGRDIVPRTGSAAPAPATDTTINTATNTEPALPPIVNYAQQPMSANAMVAQESKMHECFGGGWDEVRFVSSNTPVEVLGTGPWGPPPGQEGELGPGPYLKIRIWDGQYGWIAASAVDITFENVAQISGQCEEGDRIDWGTVVKPTPRPAPPPRATPRPVPTRRPGSSITRPTPTTGTNTTNQQDHKYRDE